MHLLHHLYSTLEFTVFSVFAEEAIRICIDRIWECQLAVTGRRPGESEGVMRGLLCQLNHLLYLREELSRIDAKITVVEKRLDLSQLRHSRLDIVQSSHESKKDIDDALMSCTNKLVQVMISHVSGPLAGAVRMSVEQMRAAVVEMDAMSARCQSLVEMFTANVTVQQSVMHPLLQRVEELRMEMEELIAKSANAQGSMRD